MESKRITTSRMYQKISFNSSVHGVRGCGRGVVFLFIRVCVVNTYYLSITIIVLVSTYCNGSK